MPGPINLANVNLSLAQFQAVASGKYNAGEVRLVDENSIEKINNHVHWTGSNEVEVKHKEVLAIKEAFVRALSQNGVAADEIRRVRAELGLSASADGMRDISLADRNIKPLTRQQIREILDRNAAVLNGAQQEVTIRTDAELHAGYRPSKQEKLARKREETNADLGATRQERYAKSIAVTMSVIGGDVDFFSREDRQILLEEALLQKARIIERSHGDPSDEPDASFQFTPADGPTMELKLGMSERDYLAKLDDIIARLDRGDVPDNDEIIVRREFRALKTFDERRDWINNLGVSEEGAVKARVAAVSLMQDHGINDYATLAVVNRLSDADAVAFLRALNELPDNVTGRAACQEPSIQTFLTRPTVNRPDDAVNVTIPATPDSIYNSSIRSNLENDFAKVPLAFQKVAQDCYNDLRARYGDDGFLQNDTVQTFTGRFSTPDGLFSSENGSRRSTPEEFRAAFVPERTQMVVRQFMITACHRKVDALGIKLNSAIVANAVFFAMPGLEARLTASKSLDESRAILQEASTTIDKCIARVRAATAAMKKAEDWAKDALARHLDIPRESFKPNTVSMRRLSSTCQQLMTDIISGKKPVANDEAIEGLFRDAAEAFAKERADVLDKIDKLHISPATADALKWHVLKSEKVSLFDFAKINAAAGEINLAQLAAQLAAKAPAEQIAQTMASAYNAIAQKVRTLFPGKDLGPDEVSSVGFVLQFLAVEKTPGLFDALRAFYDRPDVGHDMFDGQSPMAGANEFMDFVRDPEANAKLLASMGKPTMAPLYARALVQACRDVGLADIPPAKAVALFAPSHIAGRILAEALAGSTAEITPSLLRSIAHAGVRADVAERERVRADAAAFLAGPLAARARELGFAGDELPGIARAYALHKAATGCTEEEAFSAVTTPGSAAFRLMRAGGRFLESAGNYRDGLRLSTAYDAWYTKLAADLKAEKKGTPTLINGISASVKPESGNGYAKFLFDEIALNDDIDLSKEDPEDVFGAANNPAMRHMCRHFGGSCYNTLAIVPPAVRHLMYRVMDVLCPLGANEQEAKTFAWGSGDSPMFVARVTLRLAQVEALFAGGRTPTRAQILDLLYPDVPVEKRATNFTLNRHFTDFTWAKFQEKVLNMMGMLAVGGILNNTGCMLEEALDAYLTGKKIPYAPYITQGNDHIEGVVSPAAGLKQMRLDLVRPSLPTLAATGEPAITPAQNRFTFRFPDGATLVAKPGQFETDAEVRDTFNAVADKIAQLVGSVHPEQLGSVYSALTQAATAPLITAARDLGLGISEHVPLTYTLAKDAHAGAVTITYSEPVGCPVKFHWTATVALDGSSTTTELVVD